MINLLTRKTTILVVFLSLIEASTTHAQIIPDETVNSRIISQGNTFLVEGGTTRGSNIFHSFQVFSVPTGKTTYFNNDASIQNIFSRVTGTLPSNINGILKANSTANLFLLNPNGIIFGKNARLDLGGSFLGTTASSIEFADGNHFSAINPESSPLLTVQIPIGLNFRNRSSEIRVSNIGQQFPSGLSSPTSGQDNPEGLKVSPGKTLALVGGEIFLNGGAVYAPGGQIEVGSVKQGQVNFDNTNNQWSFSYDPQSTFGKIELSNRSFLDTTGKGNASIGINGREILFLEDSVALMQNQGVIPDKELKLEARDLIYIGNNISPDGLPTGLYSETVNSGSGAQITLISPSIIVQDGGVIDTFTFTSAKGGNILFEAQELLKIEGSSPELGSQVNTLTFNSGKAGNIDIFSSNLVLGNGGRLASVTFGEGHGGNISINAALVEVFGKLPITRQGSTIQAGSLGTGNAGSLEINTSKLILASGGSLSTTAFNTGNGGNLIINASEFIEVNGMGPEAMPETIITAEARIISPNLRRFFNLPPAPSGDSGSITIKTPRLMLKNGGRVSVLNEGTGNAGELKISANIIALEDNSLISAATFGGEGGNLFIFADFLLIKDSSITASATQKGTGGNITAISDLVVALGESSFTAEAEKGQGGNISITAKAAIFDPKVEFSVTSDAGLQLDGNINLDVEETGAKETTTRPPDLEASPQLISDCNPSTRDSKFVAMGPGALQVEPSHFAETDSILGIPTFQLASKSQTAPPPIENPIVEATGWTKDNGKTVLIAKTKTQSTHASSDPSMCRRS